MKILLYFFARYLLAPLFVAVMIFVLTGIKTIKSKLSLKKLIIFILLASIAVALPSLFGFLKNEYVWGGLTFTVLSYILLGALFCKLSTSDLFGAIGIGSSRTAVILTLTTICALGGWCYYLLFELISKLPYSLTSSRKRGTREWYRSCSRDSIMIVRQDWHTTDSGTTRHRWECMSRKIRLDLKGEYLTFTDMSMIQMRGLMFWDFLHTDTIQILNLWVELPNRH